MTFSARLIRAWFVFRAITGLPFLDRFQKWVKLRNVNVSRLVPLLYSWPFPRGLVKSTNLVFSGCSSNPYLAKGPRKNNLTLMKAKISL